jgi:hypothetical protein
VEPTTATVLKRPPSIILLAMSMMYGVPPQPSSTTSANASVRQPSRWCSAIASWLKFSSSGVQVTTKMASSSRASTPDCSSARLRAISHMSVLLAG